MNKKKRNLLLDFIILICLNFEDMFVILFKCDECFFFLILEINFMCSWKLSMTFFCN